MPDWQPTSEADLDQVLIDLIAADADELSDYQDRVMNEAYFGRARKRVSLARHARLMDYHIHQGNQAGTTIAVKSERGCLESHKGFGVWSGENWQDSDAVIFTGIHDQECYEDLSELSLYTWDGVVTALEARQHGSRYCRTGGNHQDRRRKSAGSDSADSAHPRVSRAAPATRSPGANRRRKTQSRNRH